MSGISFSQHRISTVYLVDVLKQVWSTAWVFAIFFRSQFNESLLDQRQKLGGREPSAWFINGCEGMDFKWHELEENDVITSLVNGSADWNFNLHHRSDQLIFSAVCNKQSLNMLETTLTRACYGGKRSRPPPVQFPAVQAWTSSGISEATARISCLSTEDLHYLH